VGASSWTLETAVRRLSNPLLSRNLRSRNNEFRKRSELGRVKKISRLRSRHVSRKRPRKEMKNSRPRRKRRKSEVP